MQTSKLFIHRKTIVIALCFVVATAALTLARQSKPKSLYDRLGGYDAISAVVEDFAPKLFNDAKISRFFVGMSTDTKEQFKQKNKNLVCNVTGGPCQVISRTAKQSHAGLGITEDDFNIVVKHLVDTLNKFKVPDAEQKELLNIIGTLKKDIVEKK
ncbi:MAG: group I truncated hemoglobin [Blastocatellia bacterium]